MKTLAEIISDLVDINDHLKVGTWCGIKGEECDDCPLLMRRRNECVIDVLSSDIESLSVEELE